MTIIKFIATVLGIFFALPVIVILWARFVTWFLDLTWKDGF